MLTSATDHSKLCTISKVLIIEDEAALSRIIETTLTRRGYEVRRAADGRDGMAHFHTEKYDLVIVDLFMPEKDGFETIRELRQQRPEVKIIAISGGGQHGNAGDVLLVAKLIGATRTLEKPFSMPEILAMIDELALNP